MNKIIKTTTIVSALLVFFSANTFADNAKDGEAAYKRGDYATAFALLKPLVDEEYPDSLAQYILGSMYDNGYGVPQDYAEAARLYRKASETISPYANYSLGVLYEHGRGVPQDYAEAAKWYLRAANWGMKDAIVNWGYMSEKLGDYPTAVKAYKAASEYGLARGQNNLGVMYHHGYGVNQNWDVAIKLYRLSAEQGDPMGQYNLGLILSSYPFSWDEAKQWLKKAIQGNDPEAAQYAQKQLNKLLSDDAAREQYDRQIEIDDHQFKCGTYIAGGASYGELSAMGCN